MKKSSTLTPGKGSKKEILKGFLDLVTSAPLDSTTEHLPCLMAVNAHPIHREEFLRRAPRALGAACYISCSTLSLQPNGDFRRRKSAFVSFGVLVLDDVGTGPGSRKNPPLTPEDLPAELRNRASYILETSPDNFQFGYVFSDAPRDYYQSARLQKIIIEKVGADPGGNSPTKLVRVPAGVNLKPQYQDADGKPFQVRLVSQSNNLWTPDGLLSASGAGMSWEDLKATTRKTHAKTADAPNDERDTVLDWLISTKRTVGGTDDWADIECQWSSNHSPGGKTIAGYSGLGRGDKPADRHFHCHHGHCVERYTGDFLSWVIEEGGPAVEDAIPPWIFYAKDGVTKKVNDVLLAESIEKSGRVRHGAGGLVYFDGRAWVDAEKWSAYRVRKLLGDMWSLRHQSEVIGWLTAGKERLGDSDISRINLTNGMYDFLTGELVPHGPEFNSTIQITHALVKGAECPAILRFLVQVLPEDALGLFFEIAGLILYEGNPYQIAILFLGLGGNGKGVALLILTILCGAENASAVPLQKLCSDKFAPADLQGKLANLGGDVGKEAMKNPEMFRTITGGDTVRVENKFQRSFNIRPSALLVFCANKTPRAMLQGPAMKDRWCILPFDRVSLRGTEDLNPYLAAELTTKSEMEGFLLKALEGLKRLHKRGRLDNPDSVIQELEEQTLLGDPVAAFYAECCEPAPKYREGRTPLYAVYSQWATSRGQGVHSLSNFCATLLVNNPELREGKPHRDPRYIEGLQVTIQASEVPTAAFAEALRELHVYRENLEKHNTEPKGVPNDRRRRANRTGA